MSEPASPPGKTSARDALKQTILEVLDSPEMVERLVSIVTKAVEVRTTEMADALLTAVREDAQTGILHQIINGSMGGGPAVASVPDADGNPVPVTALDVTADQVERVSDLLLLEIGKWAQSGDFRRAVEGELHILLRPQFLIEAIRRPA